MGYVIASFHLSVQIQWFSQFLVTIQFFKVHFMSQNPSFYPKKTRFSLVLRLWLPSSISFPPVSRCFVPRFRGRDEERALSVRELHLLALRFTRRWATKLKVTRVELDAMTAVGMGRDDDLTGLGMLWGWVNTYRYILSGLFTSINPSDFDVNRRGTRVLTHCHLGEELWEIQWMLIGVEWNSRFKWGQQDEKWTWVDFTRPMMIL